MANHLEHLARRLDDDPFFLACPLRLYAKSEGLDEETLAAGLNCSKETLLSLRLCRAPVAEDESFYGDIRRIAEKFSVDTDALADAVRLGQALFQLSHGGKESRTLFAARDGDSQKDGDHHRENGE